MSAVSPIEFAIGDRCILHGQVALMAGHGTYSNITMNLLGPLAEHGLSVRTAYLQYTPAGASVQLEDNAPGYCSTGMDGIHMPFVAKSMIPNDISSSSHTRDDYAAGE